jgi:hypothetical protein
MPTFAAQQFSCHFERSLPAGRHAFCAALYAAQRSEEFSGCVGLATCNRSAALENQENLPRPVKHQ